MRRANLSGCQPPRFLDTQPTTPTHPPTHPAIQGIITASPTHPRTPLTKSPTGRGGLCARTSTAIWAKTYEIMWDYAGLWAGTYTVYTNVTKRLVIFKKNAGSKGSITLNNYDNKLSLFSLKKPCLVKIKNQGEKNRQIE